KDDAITRAVLGLALLRLRQFTEARAAVQRDLADQVPGALIIAAYADAAQGNRKEAAAFAKDAVGLAPNAAAAHYALALASLDPRESEKEIALTLTISPFQSGPYLDYAARVAISKRQDRYEQALNLTDFVLKNDPENINAKLMQT